MTAEERRRDRLAGVFGLALAGVTAATFAAGPVGIRPAAPAVPRPATASGHVWRPNPVQLGMRLLAHATKP